MWTGSIFYGIGLLVSSLSNSRVWLSINMESGTPLLVSMSTYSPKTCILFLCLLFSSLLLNIIAATKDGEVQGSVKRSDLERLFLQQDLQANTSAFNLSSGLSRDESVLLSWRTNSAYLNANWVENNASGPCNWPGVRCGAWQGETRVTVVNLTSVNLTGAVPGRISNLSALTSLSFAFNGLTGTIPREIANCSNLQVLNLTHNRLGGSIPTELGGLVQLQSLDLSRNQLNGTIPTQIFTNCNNLTSFNVSSNNLDGSLPPGLGSCRSLRTVDFGNNSFKGEIPFAFSQLPYLEELIMPDNKGISGSIPDTLLSNCKYLRKLDMAWNNFTGALPPKLGNCSNLEGLVLQGNHFHGSIPGEIGTLKRLKVLWLGHNNLTGELPENLSQCSSLQLLDVGNNSLTGTIPTWLGQLSNLEFLTLQLNMFSGKIPVEVTELQKVRYIDLSNNLLEGRVLSEFGRMSSLRLLRISFNKLAGTLPAELGLLSKLQGLDLSSNFLTGYIPTSFGNLQDLLWLQLESNFLTGSIPTSLTNCSSLIWVNLADNHLNGSIPSRFGDVGWDSDRVFQQNREEPWIVDGIGECSILSTWSPGQSQHLDSLIDVSDTQCHVWLPLLLRGSLKLRSTRLLGERKVLRYWQLEKNNLTGLIPDLRNASTMGFLILSENRLEGPIPEQVGNLPLYNLNVSNNLLTGSIPSSLGNASLLITLDMANNDLSGALPPELSNLYALTILNVSYNPKLSGPIPSKGQFTTLGWKGYIGDVNLCFNDSDPLYTTVLANLSATSTNFDMPQLCSQMFSEVNSSLTEMIPPSSEKKIILRLEIAFISSICTIIAVLFMSSLYCIVSEWRRKRLVEVEEDQMAKKVHDFSDKSSVASFGMLCLESLTYAHLALATENFSDRNILGDGGFGIVYKATLANGVTVAIKKLTPNGAQGAREFRAEMETLGTIHHENLVSLFGYCCSNEEMLLVYEYFPNGSLDDWLYESDEKASKLAFPLRLRIALETARGLAFLHHECAHLIIHRDIKSSNILLDEHFHAVLTDFGMARIMDTDCTHVSTVVAGTPGYVPPEYSQTWRATTKGDVYSFGVVMLELLSGKRPTGPHFNGRCGSNLVEMARILVARGKANEVCDETVMAAGALGQISAFLDLAMRCTESSPLSRPTMVAVVETLEEISRLVCI
ncbi:hypothetical protein M758_8G148300 [Ceratodon purpureus]|nr:hypothetical protein M758_8G148300 [Ceratodon purpureus]